MGLANQTPHHDEWGARSEWKKSPNHTEPYALFYIFSTNQPFVAVRGWRYVLADRHPNRCRTLRNYSRIITYIITYPCRMGQTLRTNHTQLPEWTIQYSWRYARHDQRNSAILAQAVSVEWRYVRYESITFHTNYITYPPVPSVPNVLLGSLSNPKNWHLGIKVAESAIPHRIHWLLWKMAYTLTRETEMTVAGMGLVLCAAAALEIEEDKKKDKKREEDARRRVQVKRRKKVKDWLKRRVQLGHNRTGCVLSKKTAWPWYHSASSASSYTWVLKMEKCCWWNNLSWHRQIYSHQKLQE